MLQPTRPILLVVLAAAVGCTSGDPWFRTPTPRDPKTIFSPLDLPSPNGMRTASGAPGPDYWQQRVDYDMDVSLDPGSRIVSGHMVVTYTNNSPDALDYLWLHLEQNLFKQDSVGASLAWRTRGEEGLGYTIENVRSVDGDGNSGDELPFQVYDTLGRIDLPVPLGPGGESLSFELDWSFRVNETVRVRHGLEVVEQGTIFELAQWFPALAVYDDVHGWNNLPYLGNGEFYTNFGSYDVSLTVPRDHIVVATGVLQNPEEVFTAEQVALLEQAVGSEETIVIRGADGVGDPSSRPAGEGPLTWHFQADDVRTYAWASSEAFILDAAGLDGVLLQSVYPKEALPLWEQSTQMLRKAMIGLNERWYPYPYPVATNVNGIEGGMEYPMIIFCRSRTSERGLYGVTAHEIGHIWFPMVVNTDERRHAWMDEGFNTFTDYYSHADWWGEDSFPSRGDPASIAGGMLRTEIMPIDTPPDRLPRFLIGHLAYAKPGAGLVLLRESILGPERFDHAFRSYIRRWCFKSPRPADFFRTMEDAAGADLAWFWRGWFLEMGVLDQAVEGVTQPLDGEPAWVGFQNLGELVMPLVARIELEDGSTIEMQLPVEIWATSNRANRAVETSERVVGVVVDPEAAFPDVDRSNNAWEIGRALR